MNDFYILIIIGAILGFTILLTILINISIFRFKDKVKENLIFSIDYIKEIFDSGYNNILTDNYNDFLDKRNELFFGFGQIIIIAFIITVITILLLLKIISPEAGLPVLTAVSGFALAKTIGIIPRKKDKNNERN